MSMSELLGEISGINLFLLKTNGVSGIKVLDHMVWKRLFDPKVMEHCQSSYTYIEFSKDQMEELVPGEKYLTKHHIISFTVGHGATMKLAYCRLNNLGYIKAFSGVQNDSDRLYHLKNRLEISHSLALITDADAWAKDDAAQKISVKAETWLIAPASKKNLIEKDFGPKSLKKREIIAILAVY